MKALTVAKIAILTMLTLGMFVRWVELARAADPVAAKRGEYLVSAMGCADCHTPWKLGPNGPEWDMDRWLSGHPQTLQMTEVPTLPEGPWGFVGSGTMTAWAGPWGVSYTANLTPDKETGLGAWTQQEFVATMRSGRHKGMGRPILPPMPYFNIARLTDDDLHAVFSYLQSIPAIQNQVPDPSPPATASMP